MKGMKDMKACCFTSFMPFMSAFGERWDTKRMRLPDREPLWLRSEVLVPRALDARGC